MNEQVSVFDTTHVFTETYEIPLLSDLYTLRALPLYDTFGTLRVTVATPPESMSDVPDPPREYTYDVAIPIPPTVTMPPTCVNAGE